MSGDHDDDKQRQREAEAILARVRQETEPQIGAGTERMVTRAREHFGAGDVDQGDRIEVLGTRVGRGLGLVAFVVLLFWLLQSLMQP